MKHTSKTWRYEEGTKTIRTVPENYWLATVDSWDGMVKNNHKANGVLMASAPELLEEYQWLHERTVALSQALRNKGLGQWVTDWLSDGVLDGNAIKKATE
jgi:hypothetical protein